MLFAFQALQAQNNFVSTFGLGSSNSAPLSQSYLLENGNLVALAFEPTNQQMSFTTINNEGVIVNQKIHYFNSPGYRVMVQTNDKIVVMRLQSLGGGAINRQYFSLEGDILPPGPISFLDNLYSMKSIVELSNGHFLLFGNCLNNATVNCGNNQCYKNCLLLFDADMNLISQDSYGNDGAFYTPILMKEINDEIILLSNVEEYTPPKKSSQIQKIDADMELVWSQSFPFIPDSPTNITTFEDDLIISYSAKDSIESNTNYIGYHVIDSEGQTTFSNEITNDYINSYQNASAIKGLDNGQIWITGQYANNENKDVFLMKSSFSNQTLCFNTFNVPNSTAKINHILKLNDGGVILTGGSNYNGLIIRTDSECQAFPLNINNINIRTEIPAIHHNGNGILQFTLPEQFEKIAYSVHNSNGQLILNGYAVNNKRISIQHLSSGFYFAKLTDGSSNYWSQKIIKP